MWVMATESNLGTRLSEILIARQWPVYRLAKETGLSATYVQNLVKGIVKRPSLDTYERLSRALGVSVTYLRTGEDDVVPELPGTEGLPPVFARAIQDARHRLTPRQWEMAAGFLTWLATQAGEESPEAQKPPEAYGYSLPDGGQPTDVEQGEKTA